MLTKETKDRIDRARQILVGQLPLPSDQIELITIALIYKFMDDMDEQARELGGQASFFIGKLRDYAWRELVANKLSADERVTRFIHGIEELSKPENRHLPDLFQSIFRNTFLKFRDGRTLKLFLDEINGFTYGHSEELGNAFEYLLDCIGTQADNGQFRTPRNIIDFVVAAVDPQLGHTILDPACGTAGFLISAFRHIIAAHTSEPEGERARRPGDRLTAEQRQQLTRDIVGYDITPQMCRLSRVNMYLHQFASPVIHEYDTITNTARWDEKFDVILANPPFMSPHGGNQTHDKFRIAAARTEVLFADYILEHLLPDGRAGFVVPEGIIFQNNGDYVALRKWLIEEGGLWAVASLPAMIFQPYSGVKTTVLFIDRALARKRNDVLLLKIENDGFTLNTNRNPIAANDLPAALQLIEAARGDDYQAALAKLASPIQHRLVSRADFATLDAYRANAAAWDFCRKRHARLSKAETDLAALRAEADADPRAITRAERALARMGEEFPIETGLPKVPANTAELTGEFESRIKAASIAYGDDPKTPTTLTRALREHLDGQREYNLALDRSEEAKPVTSAFEMVQLGEVCKIYQPETITGRDLIEDGAYPVFGANGIIGRYTRYNHEVPEVLMTCRGATCGTINVSEPRSWITGNAMVVTPKDERIDKRFLRWLLELHPHKQSVITGSAQPQITRASLSPLLIPVPPLEAQRAIAGEIEGFQRVVEGCAAVLSGYSPLIDASPEWSTDKLAHHFTRVNELCDPQELKESVVTYIGLENIESDTGRVAGKIEHTPRSIKSTKVVFRKGDILFGKLRPNLNKVWLADRAGICSTDIFALRASSDAVEAAFFAPYFRRAAFKTEVLKGVAGAQLPRVNFDYLGSLSIHLPPIEEQHRFIAELTREQETLAGVADLRAKHEARIRARLATVWGESPDALVNSTPAAVENNEVAA